MSKNLEALERIKQHSLSAINGECSSPYNDYTQSEPIFMQDYNLIKQDLERLQEYDETLKTRCGNCYYKSEKICAITKSPLSIETLIKCIEVDRIRATNAFHKVLEEKDLLEQVWDKEEWCKGIPLSADSLKSLFNYNEELFNKNLELDKENLILKQSVKDTYDTSQEIIVDLKNENQELKEKVEHYKKLYELWKESADMIEQSMYKIIHIYSDTHQKKTEYEVVLHLLFNNHIVYMENLTEEQHALVERIKEEIKQLGEEICGLEHKTKQDY